MKTNYEIKSIFTVKPNINSTIIAATFENDLICSNDENDHDGWYGEGHRKATEYIKKNGGVIIRKTEVKYVETFISENGDYYDKI